MRSPTGRRLGFLPLDRRYDPKKVTIGKGGARAGTRSRSLYLEVLRAALKEGIYFKDRFSIKQESMETSQPGSIQRLESADVLDTLHRLVGAPLPCSRCARFLTDDWSTLFGSLTKTTPTAGYALDADPNLLLAVWILTTHLRPSVVVETGVARGFTSATILAGMDENAQGHLYSVDLPPLKNGWAQQSRLAVPQKLTGRWTYIRGSSRRQLPRLVERLRRIDLFVHDSLHTYNNMKFEFESMWPLIRPGGALIADDIQSNQAFEELVGQATGALPGTFVVGSQAAKAETFWGVVVKPMGLAPALPASQ